MGQVGKNNSSNTVVESGYRSQAPQSGLTILWGRQRQQHSHISGDVIVIFTFFK